VHWVQTQDINDSKQDSKRIDSLKNASEVKIIQQDPNIVSELKDQIKSIKKVKAWHFKSNSKRSKSAGASWKKKEEKTKDIGMLETKDDSDIVE
jgi:hypothetical protein